MQPTPDPHSGAPPRESRTWEQELLISAGTLFALLQLSGVVDDAFRRIDPHLGAQAHMVAILAFEVAKLILYTLIAAFLVHLIGRGYWVGLIGLESVFPHGVRTDRIRSGPIGKQIYRERIPPLRAMIAHTDDVCSVIFSVAFMAVFICAIVSVWAMAMAGVAFLLSRFLLGEELWWQTFWTLYALLFAPALVAVLLDKWIGNRVRPGSRTARAIRGVLQGQYSAVGGALHAPILLTLTTNVRHRLIVPVLTAAAAGIFALFIVRDVLVPAGTFDIGSYPYMPEDDNERGVAYAHYEDQRPEGKIFRFAPSIQSSVVTGPYLRLFIPFGPRRHGVVLAERCPGVKPLKGLETRLGHTDGDPLGGPESARVLACLARLQPVTLNGKPLAGLEYFFYTDPRTGIRGILAHIPTAPMPRGRNLLRVESAPRSGDATPPDPFLIPFWL